MRPSEWNAGTEPASHGSAKCPLVVPFEILHSEGPFEVAHLFGMTLQWPMAMTVFTLKCPFGG